MTQSAGARFGLQRPANPIHRHRQRNPRRHPPHSLAREVLSQYKTGHKLGANVQAAQATLPAPVLGRLAEESEAPATYWATRAALPWH
jgi:hypothetical protein